MADGAVRSGREQDEDPPVGGVGPVSPPRRPSRLVVRTGQAVLLAFLLMGLASQACPVVMVTGPQYETAAPVRIRGLTFMLYDTPLPGPDEMSTIWWFPRVDSWRTGEPHDLLLTIVRYSDEDPEIRVRSAELRIGERIVPLGTLGDDREHPGGWTRVPYARTARLPDGARGVRWMAVWRGVVGPARTGALAPDVTSLELRGVLEIRDPGDVRTEDLRMVAPRRDTSDWHVALPVE